MNIFSWVSYSHHRSYVRYSWSIPAPKPFVSISAGTHDPSNSCWSYPLWTSPWFHLSFYWRTFWYLILAQSISLTFCSGSSLCCLEFVCGARLFGSFCYGPCCPNNSLIFFMRKVLYLLLELLDYATVLDLPLHKSLLYNGHLLLQTSAFLLPILNFRRKVSTFIVIIVSCEVVLRCQRVDARLVRFTLLCCWWRRLLGPEGAVSVKHLS